MKFPHFMYSWGNLDPDRQDDGQTPNGAPDANPAAGLEITLAFLSEADIWGQAQWEGKASGGEGPGTLRGCQGDGREWWSQARKAPCPDAQTSCCCPCASPGLLLGAPLTL